MIKLNARELRTTDVDPEVAKSVPKNPIYIILDNVLDTYNVGSVFRLADAIAATKVFLCGETLIPPNSRIKKASINTTGWVNWEYCATAKEAICKLKQSVPGITVVSVEQDGRSKPYARVSYPLPVAVVVGNETHGVSQEALDASDMIVELPMWGVNVSLNVMVTCGIVLYKITEQLRQ